MAQSATLKNVQIANVGQSSASIPNGNDNSKRSGDRSVPRLIKLISVRLKEAALDSPSFRASFHHYSSQVDLTEQWIEGLIKSTKKYPQQANDFKDVNSVFLNQLIPDFLKSGLLDQETTASVLDTTKLNLVSLWSKDFDDLVVNSTEITELLSEITRTHIKRYKETRKNFEFMQSKYDSALSKYSSIAKTKEPSASREDAFQLFDIRKSYLSASLDMCTEIAKFHQVLDLSLLKLTELLFKGKDSYDEKYFSKVKAWSEAINTSVDSLLTDMNRSKEQIEKSTVAQFEPTRDLKQHNLALLNPATLNQFDPDIDNPGEEQSYEKHGWLFMKTTVGKPSRQIWVRRWVFVKSGIFGLFSLSPSKNFVQETDKIGVLLCNIRYAPDEDRRFCFEIKTIESTVVFQAENLKDLRSWLRVFSQEKQRAIDNSQSESGKYAFGRYPPLLYDFASTSLTSIDVELTSSKVENSNKDDTVTVITSSYLSQLVGQNENLEIKLPNTTDFGEPDLVTPIATAKSKLALISHAFLSPTVVPTAVTANIWGSVNWGMYYMSDSLPKSQSKINENNLSSLNPSEIYPSYYPSHLKNYDIQLKSLFNSSVEMNEFVVLHFSCLWSLNPGQELAGRCFVTTKNCYLYLNSTGFVSLLKKKLVDMVAIDVVSEKNWDLIKVYDIEGLNMKGRVFLEDGRLIQKKIDFLINNSIKDKPKTQEELIPVLESMVSAKPKLEREASTSTKNYPNDDTILNSIQPIESVKDENKAIRTNYNNEYEVRQVQSYNVPAKALFHLIYGDHSPVFRDATLFIDKDEFTTSPWYTRDGQLTRFMFYKLNLSTSFINLRGTEGNVSAMMVQSIEEIIDSKYYRIEEIRNSSKVLGGEILVLKRKIIIVEENAKSSKLMVYTKLDTPSGSKSLLTYNIYKRSLFHFHKQEVTNAFKKIEELADSLGSHGKVIKAIRTFGNLSKTDEPCPQPEELYFTVTLNLLLKYYVKVLLFSLAGFILKLSKVAFGASISLLESLSINKLLLFLLMLSVFLNLFLSGRSTVSFWRSWRAESTLANFRKELEYNKVERSLSLDELSALSSMNFNNSSVAFRNYLSSAGIKDPVSADVDSRFRKTRHEIAVKRNELLVELKILEKVEKELLLGSYKNFLISELNMCNIALDEMKIDDDSLKKYCAVCIEELKTLSIDGLL